MLISLAPEENLGAFAIFALSSEYLSVDGGSGAFACAYGRQTPNAIAYGR